MVAESGGAGRATMGTAGDGRCRWIADGEGRLGGATPVCGAPVVGGKGLARASYCRHHLALLVRTAAPLRRPQESPAVGGGTMLLEPDADEIMVTLDSSGSGGLSLINGAGLRPPRAGAGRKPAGPADTQPRPRRGSQRTQGVTKKHRIKCVL